MIAFWVCMNVTCTWWKFASIPSFFTALFVIGICKSFLILCSRLVNFVEAYPMEVPEREVVTLGRTLATPKPAEQAPCFAGSMLGFPRNISIVRRSYMVVISCIRKKSAEQHSERSHVGLRQPVCLGEFPPNMSDLNKRNQKGAHRNVI